MSTGSPAHSLLTRPLSAHPARPRLHSAISPETQPGACSQASTNMVAKHKSLAGIGRFQKIFTLYHRRLLGFLKGGGGIHDYGILRAWGVFHRWDFWSRKYRVSSLKMLSADCCGLL